MGTVAFVGRDQELATLVELVASVRSRHRVDVVVVTGEAGAGKTRLLGEMGDRVGHQRLVRVAGFEPERAIPLAAARDLLQALSSVADEGPRLAQLLDPAVADRPLNPMQICEAAHRSLAELSPDVLLVDDLQWLDELSLALVHYLIRGVCAAGSAMAFVVAARPGRRASAFTSSLPRVLPDSRRVHRISLGPLDRSAGVLLCESVSPTLGRERANQIWEQSGGLPFWLVALSQAGEGQPSIDSLVSDGLADVSADAAEMAAVLAVHAKPALPARLAELLKWPLARLEAAVDELVDRGTVLRAGPTLRFTHDLVGAAILDALPDHVAGLLHATLSDYLLERAGDDTHLLSEALWHRRASAQPCADLALRLTRSPRRRLLSPDDVRALAGLASDPRESPADAALLRWQLARLASETGNPALSLETWSALLPHAHSPEKRARAALEASRAALELGDRTLAASLLAQSRSAAGADLLLGIEVDAHQSEIEGNSRVESERPMRRAVTAARSLVRDRAGPDGLDANDRRAVLAALQSQLVFSLRTEAPEAMLRTAEEMESVANTVDDRLQAMLHAVLALRALGRYPEAERRCRTARLVAVREALQPRAFLAGYLLAGTLHHLGRLVEARTVAVEVVAFADRAPVVVPSWLSVAWVRSLVPQIDMSLRGLAASRAVMDALAESEPNPHFRLQVRLEAGLWAARLGAARDAPYAGSCLESAGDDAAAAGCDRCASEYHVRAAEAYARLGRDHEAQALLSRWDVRHGRKSSGPSATGQIGFWRRRAEALLVVADDPARGLTLLETVRMEAASQGACLEELWTQIDMGRAATVADRGRAVEVLQAAITTANRLGAVSEQRLARHLLRSAGVRSWRPKSPVVDGSPDGLTGREEEIGRMIAAGASNPEIAEAMFISRKTVERHVSNVLAKTGTRNRAELAAKLSSR